MTIIYTGTVITTEVDGKSVGNIYSGMSYISIQPIRAKFSDTVDCTRLATKIIEDNLSTHSTLYYELQDSKGISHIRANFTISGEEYIMWGTDNTYPFTILLNTLNLKSA